MGYLTEMARGNEGEQRSGGNVKWMENVARECSSSKIIPLGKGAFVHYYYFLYHSDDYYKGTPLFRCFQNTETIMPAGISPAQITIYSTLNVRL